MTQLSDYTHFLTLSMYCRLVVTIQCKDMYIIHTESRVFTQYINLSKNRGKNRGEAEVFAEVFA